MQRVLFFSLTLLCNSCLSLKIKTNNVCQCPLIDNKEVQLICLPKQIIGMGLDSCVTFIAGYDICNRQLNGAFYLYNNNAYNILDLAVRYQNNTEFPIHPPCTGNFLNDILDGETNEYHAKTGYLRQKSYFILGKLNGYQTEFAENGDSTYLRFYKNGIKISEKQLKHRPSTLRFDSISGIANGIQEMNNDTILLGRGKLIEWKANNDTYSANIINGYGEITYKKHCCIGLDRFYPDFYLYPKIKTDGIVSGKIIIKNGRIVEGEYPFLEETTGALFILQVYSDTAIFVENKN